MNDVDRSLGAFLRSLDQTQFLRFCAMIRVNPPDLNSGLDMTWEQWQDNRTTGILAAKHNNPPYYESVILHAFPSSRDGQELLRFMLTVDDNELLSVYRQVLDKSGLVLHAAQRPAFTLEILDCQQMDPGRWSRALRLSGVRQPEPQEAESKPEPQPDPRMETESSPTPSSEPKGESGRWSRGEIIGVVGVLVTILIALLGWFVFG